MKPKLSLAILATIITSSVAAQSNTIRFDQGDKLPSIPAYSTGVSVPLTPAEPPESPTLLEMMPVNYNSVAATALMATKDGSHVTMSSCLAYIDAGLGQGNDGLYQITNNGSTYPVYCNQTSFGGGFTLVVAQYENSPVLWTGVNNGLFGGSYDPSLSSKTGFSLSNAQIPAHTHSGFSQQDYDGLAVPNYVNFNYVTGNISIGGQDIKDINGVDFKIHRHTDAHFRSHEPDTQDGRNASVNNNTLVIDRWGVMSSADFAFQPQHTDAAKRGFAYGGNFLSATSKSGAWLVWVR